MRVLFAIVCALFSSFFSGVAWGQTWPSKPIRLIVPFPPGETMDIMSRLIAPKMSERLGQQVVVENRPGASGMLGLDLVAKAAPDGYTFGGGQGGNLSMLPHTSRNVPYNVPRDFVPVALSTTNFLGIICGPQTPFRTVGEMVSWAKANPGRLTVATNGEGGFPHMSFEYLRVLGNFTFTHVPYKGASAIVTDIAGGQVQCGIMSIATAAPQAKAGLVRLVAVTNKTRVPLWPDVPAAAEVVPGYESGGWFGYVGPSGMPREIVARLNDEINRAMRSPEVADKLVAAGLTVVAESPEYFASFLKSDYEKYRKLVKDIGFTPQ